MAATDATSRPSPGQATTQAQEARMLTARTALTGGTARVLVAGELDADTAPELRRELAGCLRTDLYRLLVDLEAVTFCDCAGLNVLLWARRRASNGGAAFHLVSPQPQVARLIALAGVSELLGTAAQPRRPRGVLPEGNGWGRIGGAP